MKKFSTLLICIGFLVSSNAQNSPFKMSNEELRIEQMPSRIDNQQQQVKRIAALPEIPTPDENIDIVEVIDIGTSANAYTYWKNLSYLWVDPELNTVTNIHRMGGALDTGGDSGDLGYDISKDGGMTWVNMNEIYISKGNPDEWSFSPVRYPQGGIYNPENEDNPDNAYITYFSPCLHGETLYPPFTYVYGLEQIGDSNNNKYNYIFSDSIFYQNIPLGFEITSQEKVFIVDENTDITGDTPEYRDSLIITKGIWDDDLEDLIYIRESLEAKVVDEIGAPIDYRVAFGPDGQTGYIVMLADNGEAEQVEGFKNLNPIYWRTTDAGETWEGPEVVQLDGPNGVAGIVSGHLTDQQIEDLFGNDPPPREEISYTTAYDCEISVDRNNRLHIAVVIGPTGIDPYSIVTAAGYIAAYDIFLYDNSQPFCGVRMGHLRTFRGTFGEFLECDNRIQITTNPDHDKFFISWLDTDLEEEEDNNRPNIWCRGFDPFSNPFMRTKNLAGEDAPTNVTNFSQGMWQTYFATAPKYTFEDEDGWPIPYVFIEMDIMDEMQPVQFKYVQNFKFTEADWFGNNEYFNCGWVGTEEYTSSSQPLSVIGNYPNPFKNETNIQIELYKTEQVNISVISITGQQLLEKDFGKLNQGQHDLKLELNDMSSGIYFYTITAGNERVTMKMVVE